MNQVMRRTMMMMRRRRRRRKRRSRSREEEEEDGKRKGQRSLGCLSDPLGISLGRFSEASWDVLA
eukprot:5524776-Pyramimonas_sp.AAC.1